MEREPFFINPALETYIHPLSDEEERMLEESILAEGVRDPLVVWREENVLVDGHHRKARKSCLSIPDCRISATRRRAPRTQDICMNGCRVLCVEWPRR